MTEAGTDVVLRPEDQAVHGFELAERIFTPERRAQVAQFLNIGADDPALVPYLVVCATYGLSPIMGQIWLIPVEVKVRDGDAERKEKRYRPAVGRDGFLVIARRDKRYAGMKAAVVCEHDSYEVVYDGSRDEPKVLHRFASKPTAFEEGEDPGRWRGRVLGAWAKVYADGQPPTFYYASLKEHGRTEQLWDYNNGKGKREPLWLDDDGKQTFTRTGRPVIGWAGSWDYVSTMILKAAQSYVLRIAFGITGLAPADEMVQEPATSQQIENAPTGGALTAGVGEFDWSSLTAPQELVERLRSAVDAANELSPMSWAPAKCEMVFVGLSDVELEEQALRIEREVELHSARIDPPSGERLAPVDEPEGQVEDAEVVRELSEEERGKLDVLHHRSADLQAGVEEAEMGSREHTTLMEELDGVEAEIERIDPGGAAKSKG